MTATKAWMAGCVLLAGLVLLALSVGTQGFGWGDGGSLVLLRSPRVLAALGVNGSFAANDGCDMTLGRDQMKRGRAVLRWRAAFAR
jgi:hypothetical protein